MTVISLMPDVAFAPITEGVKLEVGGFKSVPVPLSIPVTFGGNADLAAKVGTLHAIAIQHLEYLSRVLDGRMKDGKKWVRIVMKSEDESITWCGHFKGEEEKTIRGVLADLRADGLIEVTTFKGRPKWYYLNLSAVLALAEPVARVAKKKSTKQSNLSKKALSNQTMQPNRTNINLDETPLNVSNLIGGIMCPNRTDTTDLIGGIMCPNRPTSNILSNTANNQSNTQKDFAAQNAASTGGDSLNLQADSEIQPPPQDTSEESPSIQAEVTAPPCSAAPPQFVMERDEDGKPISPARAVRYCPECKHKQGIRADSFKRVNNGVVTSSVKCDKCEKYSKTRLWLESLDELPPANKPKRSPAQLVQDKWLDTIAQACGCFTPASETADHKNNYHGKVTLIGKIIKELKNLKVDLAELERMVMWFGQVNYRGKRAEKPKIADFVGELAIFRAYEQSLAAIADPARAKAIDAIKSVCVEPHGGWETVAERLEKAADWFIKNGNVDKIAGFKAYWERFAESAPDLDNLAKNWNKYINSHTTPSPKNGEPPKIRKVNTAPAEVYPTIEEVFS